MTFFLDVKGVNIGGSSRSRASPCRALHPADSGLRSPSARLTAWWMEIVRKLKSGDKNGKTTLTPRLLARLDLHGPRGNLSVALCSWHNSAPHGRSWRHGTFLLGFLSRGRAVFLVSDCELVPNGKVIG